MSTRIFVFAAYLLVACHRSNGADPGDAGPDLDGSMHDDAGDGFLPDGTPPFDDGTTYPGEGDACQFSVQCGLRQICVDDACVRHERVPFDALELGEWRRLEGAAWDASPVNPGHSGPGRLSWSAFDLRRHGPTPAAHAGLWGPTSRMYPGVDGPQLVVSLWHPSECQVMVIGPRVRVLRVRNLMCSAATVAADGRVAVAGASSIDGSNEVVLFDRDDAVIWRESIPESLHAHVQQDDLWGNDSEIGLISSLYFWDDGLVATAARGTHVVTDYLFRTNTRLDSDGLVFLNVSSSGEMSIRAVGGEDVVDGWKGWLADDNGRLVAFVNRRTGAPVSNPESDVEIAILDLESGERDQLVSQWAYEGHLFQPRAGYWLYEALDTPVCESTIFDSDEDVRSVPLLFTYSGCELPPSGGRNRHRFLEIPWSVFPTIPFREGIAHVRARMVEDEGIKVLTYDESYVLTESPVMGPDPVGFSPVIPGTSAISRYGKTLEVQTIAHENDRYLAWIEVALRRSEVGR